jgi:signal transduction histidine kinase
VPKHILCIDDDPDLGARLRRELDRLPRFECGLEQVTSPEDLDAIALDDFDLVFMDHRLGKVSAFDILGRLRDSDFARPVIVLTDQTDPQVAVRLIQNGADDYLAKEHLSARSLERAISNAESRHQRRRMEAELASTLECESRALRALERAKESAESASRSKSTFLANMSHEIRTPLTAILGYAEELREGELPEDSRREAIEVIHENGEFLLRIVSDILDLSKIEAGKLEIERIRFSPMQVVADACQLMESRARAKGIRLEHGVRGEVPETIFSDPTRTRQILINLIGNAVKFTDSGTVSVRARLLSRGVGAGPPLGPGGAPGFAEDERRLEIEVADTGVGMTEEQIARIFEDFSQGDTSTTRERGGTGLGLTISERLARRLGGCIRVESTPGEGSVFRVSVACGPLEGVRRINGPVVETGRPSRTPSGARNWDSRCDVLAPLPMRHRRLRSCHILLGEDNPMNRKLISGIVESFGATVTSATNGHHVVRLVREAAHHRRPVDLVLMDVQMPDLDGVGATRQLREAGFGGSIVALSGNAMASDRRQCLDAGFDDFVSKPIRRDQLFDVLRTRLEAPRPNAPPCESASPTAERNPE